MKITLLIIIGLSSFGMAEERFIKKNGVVIDIATTLEWQNDYSDNNNNVKKAKWIDAINYCEELSLNSQTDWRLPNKIELVSIVDYNYNCNYSPDPGCPSIYHIFDKTLSNEYWSSTTYEIHTNMAYIVNFENGDVSRVPKSFGAVSVRCVRGGE